MTTPAIPERNIPVAVPVACTLTAAGLAAQASRWEQLAARAMSGRTLTADGLRLSFRPGAGVAGEVRALVAIETECCPWATWTVRDTAEEVVVEVGSAGEGIAALHGMFTGL